MRHVEAKHSAGEPTTEMLIYTHAWARENQAAFKIRVKYYPLFPTKEKSTRETLLAFLEIPVRFIAASQNYLATLKHGKC